MTLIYDFAIHTRFPALLDSVNAPEHPGCLEIIRLREKAMHASMADAGLTRRERIEHLRETVDALNFTFENFQKYAPSYFKGDVPPAMICAVTAQTMGFDETNEICSWTDRDAVRAYVLLHNMPRLDERLEKTNNLRDEENPDLRQLIFLRHFQLSIGLAAAARDMRSGIFTYAHEDLAQMIKNIKWPDSELKGLNAVSLKIIRQCRAQPGLMA